MANLDQQVVAGFGDEWTRFDQTALSSDEHTALFESYFHIFPWQELPAQAIGFDLGCGSGRWAVRVAPRVGTLHCVDPSPAALEVARRAMQAHANCQFHCTGVAELPFADDSLDFGYSLGVLHHVPDTLEGLKTCVSKLKPGAPFLLYLYYAFDERPSWFVALWKASNLLRLLISRMPHGLRFFMSQLIALCVYWPLARFAALVERAGLDPRPLPLSAYRRLSFYTMRTDALDRFGTRLEQRFSRREIQAMMEQAGLTAIRFSDQEPYWCAVGNKRESGAERGRP